MDAEDGLAVEQAISAMFGEAERLLGALRAAAPLAEIGICLAPAANSRDSAFVIDYRDRYSRWDWRRVQYSIGRAPTGVLMAGGSRRGSSSSRRRWSSIR